MKNKKMEVPTRPTPNVTRAQKDAAQHSVQLTAFGAGWRARLGKLIIRLGCRLAKVGGN